MSQETDVRIQHNPKPLLLVARVDAGVHWGGGGTPGVSRNEGVEKGEICMNLQEIRTKFVRIRMKFVPISCEFIRIDDYGSATGLTGLATFRFGRRLGVVDAFGAGRSLDAT